MGCELEWYRVRVDLSSLEDRDDGSFFIPIYTKNRIKTAGFPAYILEFRLEKKGTKTL